MIDLEAEGYDAPIPELVAAYTAPALTAERLGAVLRLHAEYGGPPGEVTFAVFPHDDGESDPPVFALASLAGLRHCTALAHIDLFACDGGAFPDLSPRMSLPALQSAHLDIDPSAGALAVAEALRSRGVAVTGRLASA